MRYLWSKQNLVRLGVGEMHKWLCRWFGLHHYVWVAPSPIGYCKYCPAISPKIITPDKWREIYKTILTKTGGRRE